MFCIHMIVVEFFILVVMFVLYITEELNHIMAVGFDRRRFLINISVFVYSNIQGGPKSLRLH